MPGTEYLKAVYDNLNHAYGKNGVVKAGALNSSYEEFSKKMLDSTYAKGVYDNLDYAYGDNGKVAKGMLHSSFDDFYGKVKQAPAPATATETATAEQPTAPDNGPHLTRMRQRFLGMKMTPEGEKIERVYESDYDPGLLQVKGKGSNKPAPVISHPAGQWESPGLGRVQAKSNLPDIGEAIDRMAAKFKTGNKATDDYTKKIITDNYKHGDLVLKKNDKGESVLKRSSNFLDSFTDAYSANQRQNFENQMVSEMGTEDKIQYYRNKVASESDAAPGGIFGKTGELLGGSADMLTTGAVGATAMTVALPEATAAGAMTGSFGSFVALAKQFGNAGYAGEVEKTYRALKQQHPDMSDTEAMQAAEKQGLVGGASELAMGALMSTGAEFKPKVPVTGILDGILKSSKHLVTKEVPKMSALAAANTFVKAAGEKAFGVDVKLKDVADESGHNFVETAAFIFSLHALSIPGQLPSFLRPQAENIVASAPRDKVTKFYESAERIGAVPQGTAGKVEAKLTEFDKAKEPFAKLPIPEENKAALTGKAIQKQKLTDEKNDLAKHGDAFLPRIEELDGQIKAIEADMAKLYNAKDVMNVEHDGLTGDKPEHVVSDAVEGTGGEDKGNFAGKTDAEIEGRMSELEGAKSSSKEAEEYGSLEKEMEQRERKTVFAVPLDKVHESVDALLKKEKEKPNGFGAFIENKDAGETKEVATRYLQADKLTDNELMQDFSDAVRGNPASWYADGLKLRESLKEATKRGIDTGELLKRVTKDYIDAGHDEATAKSVVANMLKPIFEGAGKVEGGAAEAKGPTKVEPKVEPTEPKAEAEEPAKKGFTEAADLNKMHADLKAKHGDKKGAAIYQVANRLVNPNENTIVEIKSNGVTVKEGDKYIFKPFGNTDANSKKWTLYKAIDVTDQYEKKAAPTKVEAPKTEGGNVQADRDFEAKRQGVADELLPQMQELQKEHDSYLTKSLQAKKGMEGKVADVKARMLEVWNKWTAAISELKPSAVASKKVFERAFGEDKLYEKVLDDNGESRKLSRAELSDAQKSYDEIVAGKTRLYEDGFYGNTGSPKAESVFEAEMDNLNKTIGKSGIKTRDAESLSLEANKKVQEPEDVDEQAEGAAPKAESAGEAKAAPKKVKAAKEPVVDKAWRSKVNDLMDDAQKFNKLRKNSPERAAAKNAIMLKANELGVVVEYKMDRITIKNTKGKKTQRRLGGNKIAAEFSESDFSPAAVELVKAHKASSLLGLAIEGGDGKYMTEAQRVAALEDIRAGRRTLGAKMVYEAMQQMADTGFAEHRDNKTGEVHSLPLAEHLQELKEAAVHEKGVQAKIDAVHEEIMKVELSDAEKAHVEKLIKDNKIDNLEDLIANLDNPFPSDEDEGALNKIISYVKGLQKQEVSGDGRGGETEDGANGNGNAEADGKRPTAEQKEARQQLDSATEDLAAAQSAFDAKRKALDKGLLADQEDMFGERKAKGGLIDERASKEARDKAMEPLKARLAKAKAEVERLHKKVESLEGEKSAVVEMDFDGKDDVGNAIDQGVPKDAPADIKKKVSDFFDGLKLGEDNLYALPIPPKLWNKFVDIVKEATLTGIDLATAVKEGVKYLVGEGLSAAEIKDTEDHFANLIKVKQATRKAPVYSATEMEVARAKFKNALNPEDPTKPGFFSRLWENLKNHSYFTDNPNRYITRLQHSIEDYYKKKTGNLALGRVFEQNTRGRAMLKVSEFVKQVVKGLKRDQIDDFHEYVFARRIIDRHEEMLKDAGAPLPPSTATNLLGTGKGEMEDASRATGNITLEDAVNIIRDMEQRIGRDVVQDFNDRAGRMQTIMLENLDLLVKSGVLSKDALEEIKAKNDFYAPFAVVQELARQNDGAERPAVASNVVKRVTGISFKPGEYQLKDIKTLLKEYKKGNLKKAEFYHTATVVLDNLLASNTITDAQYSDEMSKLADAGFAVTNIFDKVAAIIFDSQRIAHKNELMLRLAKLQKLDTQGLFIKKVDGFEVKYDRHGNAVSVAKPIEQIKTEEGFGVIGYRLEGKQKFMAIDRKAADTIKGLDSVELSAWMKGVNLLNAVFRTGVITISPAFQAANFIIDFFRNASMNKYGLITGKTIGDAIANSVLFVPQYINAIVTAGLANIAGKHTSLYEEFMKSDAYTSGMFDDPFKGGRRKLNLYGKSTFDHVKFGGIDKLFHLVEGIGKTFEQSHKLVSLERGLDVEGMKRIGVARIKDKAEEMQHYLQRKSKTLTLQRYIQDIKFAKTPEEMTEAMDRIVYETQNFAGSPNFQATHGGMRVLSVVLQFFSARIKGEFTDYRRIVTAFGGNAEGIKMSKLERAQMLGQFAAVITPIVLMSLRNNADDKDEANFASQSPYDRDNNINIPYGTFQYETETGQRLNLQDYIRVPVRGVYSSYNVMANSFVKYAKHKDKATLVQGMTKTLANMSPLNMQGDTPTELMESAVPGNTTSAFKWYLELGMNRDTYKHRELKPYFLMQRYNKGLIPVYEVYGKKTPQWAKDMSKWLAVHGGIQWTPIALDHFENTMMGNVSESFGKNMVSKRLKRSDSKNPLYKEQVKK